MEIVQPIKDMSKIEELKSILRGNSMRDYLLFVLGINTGFRISDILNLTVQDVRNKTHICIREQKTNKEKRALINPRLKAEIDNYINDADENAYLFISQKGENKPISRVQAYRILNDAAASLGLSEIGTHTLRKTFGYWHYQKHNDVALLQKLFNHSAPSVTLRYIGIDQDMMDESMKDFFL
ncbi:site-specific integrase [Hydrogenispora ethanolica]|jgi:integrase|uniref:site-specific integrase n=1 Tax=Hydrogenispora ethanolica TaxID=1082276 RepID=UPI00104F965F|nr:site-specific integrase [Hydrogenispora ethanolica]